MPGPFRSSGTAPDLLCKLAAHLSPSHMVSQILEYIRDNALVCVLSLSTRGGFVALSPISPQDMFLQPFSHSREEKEEEDDDYHSPYHPYHHPHGHHLHLHNLVKNMLVQMNVVAFEEHASDVQPFSSFLLYVGAGCNGV